MGSTRSRRSTTASPTRWAGGEVRVSVGERYKHRSAGVPQPSATSPVCRSRVWASKVVTAWHVDAP